MSALSSLARQLGGAAADIARRPWLAVALAVPGLLTAWLVVAPAHAPLAAAIDPAPAVGPPPLADLLAAAPGLMLPPAAIPLLHGGTAGELLGILPGQVLPATLLAGAALLGLLHGPLQCAALAQLRRSPAGAGGLLAAAARLAIPATALSLLALGGYGAALLAGLRLAEDVGGGDRTSTSSLAGLGVALVALAVLGLLFAVRSLLDLSRVLLVERRDAGWLRPALAALGWLPRLALPLALLYAIYGLLRAVLIGAAWPLLTLTGGSWGGLLLGFGLQQILAVSLAGARLARLQAVRRLLGAAQARSAPAVYKVELPGPPGPGPG